MMTIIKSILVLMDLNHIGVVFGEAPTPSGQAPPGSRAGKAAWLKFAMSGAVLK